MQFKTSILAVASLLTATCSAIPSPPKPTQAPAPGKGAWTNYSTVPGFFLQDEESTNPTGFDYTQWNFGLLNRTYSTDKPNDYKERTQWQRFSKYVKHLNAKSGKYVNYKVIFMGRHGEGYHNAAESYFGTPAWNCYWSLLDGNATTTWADALLTPEGVHQAEIAASYWASRFKDEKLPFPDVYYSSPLSRCLETARITFANQKLHKNKQFKPIVKEFLREGISGHTCDRRRTKSYIRENWPGFSFEKGFTEKDELYRDFIQEGGQNQDNRNKVLLDDILGGDERNTWISISSHSGEITSILRVIKHRPFRLATGGIIPVLVRIEKTPPPAPATTTYAWASISTCATAPTTAAVL